VVKPGISPEKTHDFSLIQILWCCFVAVTADLKISLNIVIYERFALLFSRKCFFWHFRYIKDRLSLSLKIGFGGIRFCNDVEEWKAVVYFIFTG
jgi:hypothetical protein